MVSMVCVWLAGATSKGAVDRPVASVGRRRAAKAELVAEDLGPDEGLAVQRGDEEERRRRGAQELGDVRARCALRLAAAGAATSAAAIDGRFTIFDVSFAPLPCEPRRPA